MYLKNSAFYDTYIYKGQARRTYASSMTNFHEQPVGTKGNSA